MPQFKYRANLSSAIFPMTLAKSGRSVINSRIDQNFDKRVDSPGDSTKAVGIPQAIYMENILPTPDGFQSIGFKPVGGIDYEAVIELSAVERVRIALNTSEEEITDDVDVLDEGDQIETWTRTPEFFYESIDAPVNSGGYYESTTAEESGRYLVGSAMYSQGDLDYDTPAAIIKNFGVANSTVMELDVEIYFDESSNAVTEGLPDDAPEKSFMVGLGVNSAGNGIKVFYTELDNLLRLSNYNGIGFSGRVFQFSSPALAALAFNTEYRLNIEVTQTGPNRSVTATLYDAADVVLGSVSGIYVAGYSTGGYVLLSAQRTQNGPVDWANYGITITAGALRTYFDNIHVTGDVADETVTIVSGLENVDIAFDEAGVSASWSRADSEDWENNPVSSTGDLLIDNSTKFSTASVRGISYVCLRNAGVTKIYSLALLPPPDEDTLVFTEVTADIEESFSTEFTANDIISISGSFNYLLLHTATVVFWSSTTTPTDFAPSLVSGAGSETPGNLKGDISFLKEHVAGFFIYSTKNVIFAAYTGNRAYPWKFREIGGSSGYTYSTQVTGDTNALTHFGLSNSRFIQSLAPDSAQLQSPEVTDFLERVRKWDIFNSATNTFSTSTDSDPSGPTPTINNEEPRIWFVLDRYILIPYGVVNAEQYSYCIVFDVLLNRYGKLKLTFDQVTTDETNIYFVNYQTLERFKLYFDMRYMGEDPDFQHEGVLLLGKFELERGRMVQLEGVEIESALSEITGAFSTYLLPSLNGKTFGSAVALTRLAETTNELARYPAHTVGQNISVLLKGAFDVNTLQLTAVDAGEA